MTLMFVELAFMLVVILIAAEVFTNALEHLGERLKISEGVTGSLFAAVGTALPETMVPLLALAGGTANQAVNEEIGVGAILGAPLMLATLTTFLMTLAVIRSRGLRGTIAPERTGFVRDMNYFSPRSRWPPPRCSSRITTGPCVRCSRRRWSAST